MRQSINSPFQAAIGTDEVLILPANDRQVKRLLQNVGGQPAYLRFGFSARPIQDSILSFFNFQDTVASAVGTDTWHTYGSPTYNATGKIGKSIKFTTNQYLSSKDSGGDNFNTIQPNSWSMAGWFKLTDAPGFGFYPIVIASAVDEQSLGIIWEPNSSNFLLYTRTGTAVYSYAISGFADIDDWNFLAVVSLGNGDFYVSFNGGAFQEFKTGFIFNPSGEIITTVAYFADGGYAEMEADSLAFWRRPLSLGEVLMLYNSGSGVAYADLPAKTVNPYNYKLAANETLDLTWFSGNLYAVGAAATTINVNEFYLP